MSTRTMRNIMYCEPVDTQLAFRFFGHGKRGSGVCTREAAKEDDIVWVEHVSATGRLSSCLDQPLVFIAPRSRFI